MWKYNNTNNLYGDSLYHSADELYHYGVLGMRWGHRKNSNVMKAYNKFNNAKAKAELTGSNSALKAREKAAFELIDAKAKYAYDKKLNSKFVLTKDPNKRKAKAKKAMEKVYNKAGRQDDYSGYGQDHRYQKYIGKKLGQAAVLKLRHDRITDKQIENGLEIYNTINNYRNARDAYLYRSEQQRSKSGS